MPFTLWRYALRSAKRLGRGLHKRGDAAERLDMTVCIGSFGGGVGTWYAELDFDNQTAFLQERSGTRIHNHIAEVQLGECTEEDDDYEPELLPGDERNQRLMLLIMAKEMKETLERIKANAEKYAAIAEAHAREDGEKSAASDRLWKAAYYLTSTADDAAITLGRLEVPNIENPKHAHLNIGGAGNGT